MTSTLFELENVTFSAGGRMLLQPLTMAIPAGSVTALIGHNGSGKSTLLKILARQQPASGGTIRFYNKNLDQWGDREFARKLAYLPQYTAQASGMLVKELVALGRYPWHGALGRFGDTDRKKVEEAIELTGIGTFADRLVDTLSGGERQRVWIAMLVAQDAQCLLLDEPTSALDIAHQLEVLSLVQKLSQEKQLSVFIVLHDVNMAARFCDSIFALHGGRLIAQSTPAGIMEPEQLREIYGVPMDVIRHAATGHLIAAPL
ncbi:ATP-binding cassette domain-containing protein [Brucella sp. BE17]|uniref:ATP-binding cassette domain-containing protein n=1 Tax=Brucella sp. BE17 TaxID=3142977 RepID=UPI0031B9F319